MSVVHACQNRERPLKDAVAERVHLATLGVIDCADCPLVGAPVVTADYRPGEGKAAPSYMGVAESPGPHEAYTSGYPLSGPSGRDLNSYLSHAGLDRDNGYFTNVIHCFPGLKASEATLTQAAKCCAGWVRREIDYLRPRVIAAIGRFAVRELLRDVLGDSIDMDRVHGLHYNAGDGVTVVPCYHPAYGLHTGADSVGGDGTGGTRAMQMIADDFAVLGEAVRGNVIDWHNDKVYECVANSAREYRELTTADEAHRILANAAPSQYANVEKYFNPNSAGNGVCYLLSLDTEYDENNARPWGLSFCVDDRAAYVIRRDNVAVLAEVHWFARRDDVLTVMHNAQYDIPVLSALGVHPHTIVDTMVAAYLLRRLPQGLKALAYRLLYIEMSDYNDVVGPAAAELALEYLYRAASIPWPKPEPELVCVKGVYKIKQPQSINRKIDRALSAYHDDNSYDLRAWWAGTDCRATVERELGRMPVATLDHVGAQTAINYAAEDAYVTRLLWPEMLHALRSAGLQTVFTRDTEIIPMIADMATYGIGVDADRLTELDAHFACSMNDIGEYLDSTAQAAGLPVPFNPNSVPQVQDLLHSLGLQYGSTSKKVLSIASHDAPKKIAEYREYQKLRSSFVAVLRDAALNSHDGRVHATFNTTRTASGRLSTSEPNLMAQPVRSTEGRKIRGAFTASPGCVFVANDYSQIEMRIAAHVSGDARMIEIFNAGQDIHAMTACDVFGITLDQVDEMKHRYPCKRVGFGVLYAIGPQGLLREFDAMGATGWNEQLCADLIAQWFKVYAGVKKFMDNVRAFVRRNGYIKDLWGNRRYIPELLSHKHSVREAGYRQACNHPIQSGAQGVIKEAMARLVPVYKSFNRDAGTIDTWGNTRVWPILQIHDDLMFEMSLDVMGSVLPVVKSIMESCTMLRVPVLVDSKYGPCWDGMQKLK